MPSYRQIGNFGEADLTGVPASIIYSSVQQKFYVGSIVDPGLARFDALNNAFIDALDVDASDNWETSFALCLSPDHSLLYVAGHNTVSGTGIYVVDLATFTLVDQMFFTNGVGFIYGPPRGMEISPDGSTLWITDERTGITQVDTATMTETDRLAIGTAAVDDKTCSVMSADGSTIYVAIGTSVTVDTRPGKIAVIDTATLTLTSLTTLTTFANEPWITGLCLTSDGATLYGTDTNNGIITAIDTVTVVDTTLYGLDPGEASLWIRMTSDDAFLLFQDAFISDNVYVLQIVGPTLAQTVPVLVVGFGVKAEIQPNDVKVYIANGNSSGGVTVLGPLRRRPQIYRRPT